MRGERVCGRAGGTWWFIPEVPRAGAERQHAISDSVLSGYYLVRADRPLARKTSQNRSEEPLLRRSEKFF